VSVLVFVTAPMSVSVLAFAAWREGEKVRSRHREKEKDLKRHNHNTKHKHRQIHTHKTKHKHRHKHKHNKHAHRQKLMRAIKTEPLDLGAKRFGVVTPSSWEQKSSPHLCWSSYGKERRRERE